MNKDFCPCYYNTSALSDMAEKKVLRPLLILCVFVGYTKDFQNKVQKSCIMYIPSTYVYCTISLSLFSVFLWMCLFLSKNRKPRCCFWLQAIYIPGAQSFTSFMAYPLQDINLVSSFSRCHNGTFYWRNCFVKSFNCKE